MKLYELFTDFTQLSEIEKLEFIQAYRSQRALELVENIEKKKRISLTEEEKQLIKSLGITQKDLMALKRSING